VIATNKFMALFTSNDKFTYGLLSLLITILLSLGFVRSDNVFIIIASIAIPLIFITLFRTSLLLNASVMMIFIHYEIIYFSISEILLWLSIISFFLTKKIDIKDCFNNYTKYLLVFLVAILPSYYNAITTYQSFLKSMHLVTLLLMISILPNYFNNSKRINHVLNAFLIMGFCNAIHTLYEAITTGERVFGFTGVLFCDLSSFAFLIVFYRLLIGEKKILNSVLSLIFFSAHLATQTRNSTISLIATLLIMFALFINYHQRFGLRLSNSIIKIIGVFAFVIISIITVQIINPSTFNRITQNKVSESGDQTEAQVQELSTIATRFFIWNTAWNAFRDHPYIGVGMYRFQYVSKDYFKYDKALYERFVVNLTSHQTEIGLLAETGVLGLLGFLIFQFLTYLRLWKILKYSWYRDNWKMHFLIIILNIYMFFAMVMSDAYIAYSSIVVWGLVLALAIANENNIKRNIT